MQKGDTIRVTTPQRFDGRTLDFTVTKINKKSYVVEYDNETENIYMRLLVDKKESKNNEVAHGRY